MAINKRWLYLSYKIAGEPLAVGTGLTILLSWLFQLVYLREAVLSNDLYKQLVASFFQMAGSGAFAVTIRVILRRYHTYCGKPVPPLARTLLMILMILWLICLVGSGIVALVALVRIVMP